MNNDDHSPGKLVDTIRSQIPEFSGYEKKDLRTRSENSLKMFWKGRFERFLQTLAEIIRTAAENKRLDLLNDFGELESLIQDLNENFTGVSDEYNCFFELEEISSDNLLDIYIYDSEILDGLNEVDAKLAELSGNPLDRKEVSQLITVIERLKGRFLNRCQCLCELEPAAEKN